MQHRFSGKWASWIIILLLISTLKIIAANPAWVEQYYTYGLYPAMSMVLRYLFGWVPFSIGDILYISVLVYVIYKLIRMIKRIRRKELSKQHLKRFFRKTFFAVLVLYVLFYGLWGLNYSRSGIASQLGLKEQKYTSKDIDTLVGLLHSKLNHNADLLTLSMRDSFKTKQDVFFNASLLYKIAATKYPFLVYKGYSVKPSIFSYLGNELGFQGYYNTFTGEVVVKAKMTAAQKEAAE